MTRTVAEYVAHRDHLIAETARSLANCFGAEALALAAELVKAASTLLTAVEQ